MRCPKCGSELDLKLMECDRCGLATPQGKPQPSKENKEKSISPSGKLANIKPKSSWLPAFLAHSPLNKVNVPPVVVILAVLAFPLLAVGYYIVYESGICINCIEVGGTYSTEITIDEQPVKLDLFLYQYGSSVTGQVRFAPKIDATDKNAKRELFIENLDQISVKEKKIFFQSKIKNNTQRVKFSGLIEPDKTLKGNLIVTIPELNCNGRSFAISIKKS